MPSSPASGTTSAPRRRSPARPRACATRSPSGEPSRSAPPTSRSCWTSSRIRPTPRRWRTSSARPTPCARSSSASGPSSCSPATTTPRTPSCRSARAPAAPRPPTGRRCCCACTSSWAKRHRFKADVVDSQEGDQAGIKSATVTFTGRFAYGWLRAERGVHRLVRISPYDAQNRRQTTFALIEVMPEADDDVAIELNWDEIRTDTFRSSGAGGQHVQKTESAIRLTHIPTGIVVSCQNERSATQNREIAIRVLKSRLLELELEKREEELQQAPRRARDGRLGQPDPLLRAAPVPDGQGPADRPRDVEHRAPSWTATSTCSCRPSWSAWRPGGRPPPTPATSSRGRARGPRVPDDVPARPRRGPRRVHADLEGGDRGLPGAAGAAADGRRPGAAAPAPGPRAGDGPGPVLGGGAMARGRWPGSRARPCARGCGSWPCSSCGPGSRRRAWGRR